MTDTSVARRIRNTALKKTIIEATTPAARTPRRKYDEEFKEQALRMIQEGRSVKSVAEGLGISENLLHRQRQPLPTAMKTHFFVTEKPRYGMAVGASHGHPSRLPDATDCQTEPLNLHVAAMALTGMATS